MRKFVFLTPGIFESRLQRPQALAIEIAKLGYPVYFPSKTVSKDNVKFSDHGIYSFNSDLEIKDINKQLIVFDSMFAKNLDHQDVVVVMHPNWQVEAGCKAHTHYDLMDRWWEFENADTDLCISQNHYWLNRSDSVSVSSSGLLADVANRPDAKVVWNATFPNSKSKNSNCKRICKLRFIYVGAISHWIDFDSINRIAKLVDFFKGELVIVGQIEDPRICALLAYKSVHFKGELNHDDAMDLMRTATAGLIPFSRTKLTEAVDPIKVYEYLESGLSVFGLKLDSYNPSIRDQVSPNSFLGILLHILFAYFRSLFFNAQQKSKLKSGNYWSHRASVFLETVNTRD